MHVFTIHDLIVFIKSKSKGSMMFFDIMREKRKKLNTNLRYLKHFIIIQPSFVHDV